jgi:hypothetical protein
MWTLLPGFAGSVVMGHGGGGFSAEASQFFSRITDPGATRKGQYATMINALVSAGVWTKLAGGRRGMMIILTANDATKVRGISPSVSYAALNPAPLKDGTFALGDEVLFDRAHEDVRDFLVALPTTDVKETDRFSESDTLPVLPTWKDAGVRKST